MDEPLCCPLLPWGHRQQRPLLTQWEPRTGQRAGPVSNRHRRGPRSRQQRARPGLRDKGPPPHVPPRHVHSGSTRPLGPGRGSRRPGRTGVQGRKGRPQSGLGGPPPMGAGTGSRRGCPGPGLPADAPFRFSSVKIPGRGTVRPRGRCVPRISKGGRTALRRGCAPERRPRQQRAAARPRPHRPSCGRSSPAPPPCNSSLCI